ncbi:acetyl-CoA hydrolase [Leucoagaricus gongylophorus]
MLIGGSADFLRNAKLPIRHTPSSRPTKTDATGISCIVPFASHIDQTEHQGLADLRGLAPREPAPLIIEKCAHPDFKDMLHEVREGFSSSSNIYAERISDGNSFMIVLWMNVFPVEMGHEPHMLRNALKMHIHLMEKGTMKVDKWD